MAKIDVIMPQMGESIAEGTLSRWIKKVGDPVKRDEPIFEISTDKVDAEIPSPAAGVLAEILVQEGETVAVQTVVAKIESDAGAAATAPEKPATPPAPPAAATRPATEPGSTSRQADGNGGAESAEERLRRRSTPLVRKMAAEHNLDISAIPGSGLAGRVTKNDILGYLEQGAPAPASAGIAAPAAPRPAPSPAAAPSVSVPAGPTGVEPWPGDRVEPWSRIRKLTAEHMV